MDSPRFPEFDPLRNRFRRITALTLVALAAIYWRGTWPDMGAALFLSIPAIVIAVLVQCRWAPANLLAGVFALGWFSHGVMLAYVEPAHRWWSLAIVALSLIIVFSVSWVGLKVRKAKRQASS